MLFNSYSFLLVFLPLTLAAFYALLIRRGLAPAIGSLCVASFLFYSWWNIAHVPLLMLSIAGNYLLATRMAPAKRRERKTYFILGITFNLALLGFFKYADFVVENLRAIGWDTPLTQLALPLGISFFTFQQIAFLRGIYGRHDKMPSLLRYTGFITFFPHLIAGPILHHKEIQPQFGKLKRAVPWEHIALGITIFSLGLFKKAMIADPLGTSVDPLFLYAGRGEAISFVQGWAAAFLYGFQLYFDFSGYTDMAIGLAHLFGITFPKNFDSPYRSTSIAEFWRRWHITLSQFIRDFVYIPLGGNRRGLPRTFCNVIVTMALGGLWHGASWNFVLWGLLHGAYLGIHALWETLRIPLPRWLGWTITLTAVMVAWVLFRAPDLPTAFRIYEAMLGTPRWNPNGLLHVAYWLSGCLAITLLLPNTLAFVRERVPALHPRLIFAPNAVWALVTFAIFTIGFLHMSRLHIFLYFNF